MISMIRPSLLAGAGCTLLAVAAPLSLAQTGDDNAAATGNTTATAASNNEPTTRSNENQRVDKVDIATWNQADLYQGWSASALLDLPVRDQNGESFGEVHNIIVGIDGSIQKIVVEAGGFMDIGDTHLAVAWDEVKIGPAGEYVTVAMDADSVDQFSLFDNDENVETGPRAWRVTELMDDYVRLQDTPSYAVVDDLIFDRDGALQAVLVIPDVSFGRPGRYAYPYYGYDYAYDPGMDSYRLPYNRSEIENLEPFDMGALREVGFSAMEEEPAGKADEQ